MTRCDYCEREGDRGFVRVELRDFTGRTIMVTWCKHVKACTARRSRLIRSNPWARR